MEGYRLEGENADIRTSNSIWAFTPGVLSKGGWLSDKAVNMQMLTEKGGDFDYSLKHSAKNKMTIAVPRWVRNLVYKKGTSFETFLIKFFDRANVEMNPTPKHTIVFRKVIILNNIARDFDKLLNGNNGTMSYQEILLEIKNGYEFYSA